MNWFQGKKIVVPIDFSEQAFEAIEYALQLESDPRNLHIVHVLQELNPMEPGVLWESVDNEERKRKTAVEVRKHVGSRFDQTPVTVSIGDPGHEIVALAEAEGAALIVMPTHGRRGLKRLLIGSVTERVIRLAHCPVLVIRS